MGNRINEQVITIGVADEYLPEVSAASDTREFQSIAGRIVALVVDNSGFHVNFIKDCWKYLEVIDQWTTRKGRTRHIQCHVSEKAEKTATYKVYIF